MIVIDEKVYKRNEQNIITYLRNFGFLRINENEFCLETKNARFYFKIRKNEEKGLVFFCPLTKPKINKKDHLYISKISLQDNSYFASLKDTIHKTLLNLQEKDKDNEIYNKQKRSK